MTKVALAVLIQFPFHLNGISGLDLDPDPSQEVTDPNNIHIRHFWKINPTSRKSNPPLSSQKNPHRKPSTSLRRLHPCWYLFMSKTCPVLTDQLKDWLVKQQGYKTKVSQPAPELLRLTNGLVTRDFLLQVSTSSIIWIDWFVN